VILLTGQLTVLVSIVLFSLRSNVVDEEHVIVMELVPAKKLSMDLPVSVYNALGILFALDMEPVIATEPVLAKLDGLTRIRTIKSAIVKLPVRTTALTMVFVLAVSVIVTLNINYSLIALVKIAKGLVTQTLKFVHAMELAIVNLDSLELTVPSNLLVIQPHVQTVLQTPIAVGAKAKTFVKTNTNLLNVLKTMQTQTPVVSFCSPLPLNVQLSPVL
jgi:hypothetical protein